MSRFKRSLVSVGISAALAAGSLLLAGNAAAMGKSKGHDDDDSKYLIVWMSDQAIDGRNASPLDSVVGVPAGTLPDSDFLAVIDANRKSPTYGQVVNTALAPVVIGAHLLADTENFVDNAIDIVVGGDGSGTNFPAAFDDALGVINGVPAPSSILNEAHHLNVEHVVDPVTGRHTIYPGGLISANVLGCDITDPMHIKPAYGAETGLSGAADNTCGLTMSGAASNNFSGTDDLLLLANGNLISTWMGAKGTFNADPARLYKSSLPPTLTTPGGLVEIDPTTGMFWEYTAVPKAPVPGHGTFDNGDPMLGPARYAIRSQLIIGGVDGNGNPVGGPLAPAGVGLGPDSGKADTGVLAHPHGLGVRSDLSGTKCNADLSVCSKTNGIVMASDYADPVSLALTGNGAGPATSQQDLGTTIRLWDESDMAAGPYAVVQMPDGPRVEENQIHEENEGLMAMALTNKRKHKGAFVASMCGGIIYYSHDITVAQPVFKQVYDFGACTGASVFVVTRDDKHLVIPISGIQTAEDLEGDGPDPIHERDYPGEHDGRIVTLDIRALVNSDSTPGCDAPPVTAFNNSGDSDGDGLVDEVSPIDGSPATVGAAGPIGHEEHDSDVRFGNSTIGAAYTAGGDGAAYWPNNNDESCPKIASVVKFDGEGDDGIANTADDHPDAEFTRGGPHFVVLDEPNKMVATSNYFVDLREFPVGDVDTLLGAVGLNTADDFLNIQNYNAGNSATLGLGLVSASGNTVALPGTGSVGDDTVCMMKLKRKHGKLKLDKKFNAADDSSPTGCIDMDFGDSGKAWPGPRGTQVADGADATSPGNATPHAMTFIDLSDD